MKKQLLMGVLFSVLGCGAVYSQDIIVTKDAKKIEAKITEVSKSEIRYKEFDNLDGPIFVLSTDEINTIIYSNGKVTLFETYTPQKESQEVQSGEGKANVANGQALSNQDESGNVSENANTMSKGKANLYHGYLELSGFFESLKNNTGLYVGNNIAGGIGLDGIDGCRFNKYVFLGIGIGLYAEFYSTKVDVPVDASNFVRCDLSATTLQSPLFGDLRLYLPIKNESIYPFLETSVGPLFNYYSRSTLSASGKNIKTDLSSSFHVYAFFRIGVGLEIKRFTIGAGYEFWGDNDAKSHMGFVKIGYRLGNNIY